MKKKLLLVEVKPLLDDGCEVVCQVPKTGPNQAKPAVPGSPTRQNTASVKYVLNHEKRWYWMIQTIEVVCTWSLQFARKISRRWWRKWPDRSERGHIRIFESAFEVQYVHEWTHFFLDTSQRFSPSNYMNSSSQRDTSLDVSIKEVAF